MLKIMKKRQSEIIILIFVLVILLSCKRNQQTDKPLNDVLVEHKWKTIQNKEYYMFFPDSTFYYSYDKKEAEKPEAFPNFKAVWHIEYKDKIPEIITEEILLDTVTNTHYNNKLIYQVIKYTEHNIYTYQKYVKIIDTDTFCCNNYDIDASPNEVIFKAVKKIRN